MTSIDLHANYLKLCDIMGVMARNARKIPGVIEVLNRLHHFNP